VVVAVLDDGEACALVAVELAGVSPFEPQPAHNATVSATAIKSAVCLLLQNTNVNVYLGRDPEESFCEFKY